MWWIFCRPMSCFLHIRYVASQCMTRVRVISAGVSPDDDANNEQILSTPSRKSFSNEFHRTGDVAVCQNSLERGVGVTIIVTSWEPLVHLRPIETYVCCTYDPNNYFQEHIAAHISSQCLRSAGEGPRGRIDSLGSSDRITRISSHIKVVPQGRRGRRWLCRRSHAH
jgi:hypothetical protein